MEVELKLRIQEGAVADVRAKLAASGAQAGTSRVQDDLFFQHPARDMVTTDEALRLRREAGGLELTYKGPRQPGDAKTRPEINIGVAADPTALLEALGFTAAARLVKTREPWAVPGAEVAIDHVEGVGWFVEIEATDHPEPHDHVEAVRQALALGDAEALTSSYLEMALAAGGPAASRL